MVPLKLHIVRSHDSKPPVNPLILPEVESVTTSVFRLLHGPDYSQLPTPTAEYKKTSPYLLSFDIKIIIPHLANLKPGNHQGSDGIRPKAAVICGPYLPLLLLNVFTNSITAGAFPVN